MNASSHREIGDSAGDASRRPHPRADHLASFFDDNGLEIIGRDECLRLLGGVSVARVGLTSGALPIIVPVNITLATLDPTRGPEIFMRSVKGTKLAAALQKAVIAVEADAIDPMSHGGWSVLVRGSTRVIEEPSEHARALQLPLQPWASPGAELFIAVSAEVITGRRVVPWNRPQ